ncbi:MAG: hypothetical protein FWG42_09900 [Clostridiales bacterium]|nr:hypothetical protein [Clostridiales bacterium]
MREAIAILTGGFLYSAILGGYMLLFYEEIVGLSRAFRVRSRLSAARKRYRDEDAMTRHLDMVLQATMGGAIKSAHFIWLCGLLFFGVCVVALRSMEAASAIAAAFACALLPYTVLRIKLEIMRKKSSYEGEAFVGNFLSAYRISSCNIFEAMEKTGKSKQKTKSCSELMVRILLEIRGSANHVEISRATGKFAYAINTNWGRMLAYNIKLAVTRGTNISLALEDILIQLREAKAACEERKRVNAEAARIVKFFIPALYCLSVFMSVRQVGISLERYIYNQIFTAQGFMMFTAAVLLFVLNLVLLELVNNQQFDY